MKIWEVLVGKNSINCTFKEIKENVGKYDHNKLYTCELTKGKQNYECKN